MKNLPIDKLFQITNIYNSLWMIKQFFLVNIWEPKSYWKYE